MLERHIPLPHHSSSHPLRFSTTDDGTHGGGDEYAEGALPNQVV